MRCWIHNRNGPIDQIDFLEKHWVGADPQLLNVVADSNAVVCPDFVSLDLLPTTQVMGSVHGSIAPVTLTVEDLQLLAPQRWIGDGVVNAYMNLLDVRQFLHHGRRTSAFVDTQFYALLERNHFQVDNHIGDWLQARYCEAVSDVHIPVHFKTPEGQGLHWVHIVAHMDSSELVFHNSMPDASRASEVLTNIGRALNAALEMASRRPKVWKHVTMLPPTIPRQADGCNCALFVCAIADCISAGRPVQGFGSDMMDAFRIRLRQLLCKCRLQAKPACCRQD